MVSSKQKASFCIQCGAKMVDKVDGEGKTRCAMRNAHCGISSARISASVARRGRRSTCSECGWIWYNNPVPVVAAVVEQPTGDSSQVILVRAVGWPAGFFGLVTGFLERGEAARDAVLREVQEELGLAGEVADFLGVFDFQRLNQLIIAFHVRVPPGDIKLDRRELEEHKAVPIHRLRAFPGPTGEAVKEFLVRRARAVAAGAPQAPPVASAAAAAVAAVAPVAKL
jgi:NADH pyrophosphatase NudC (nudix superfamily)